MSHSVTQSLTDNLKARDASASKKEKSNIHTDQNQACASLNTQLVGLLKKCCHK